MPGFSGYAARRRQRKGEQPRQVAPRPPPIRSTKQSTRLHELQVCVGGMGAVALVNQCNNAQFF